MSGGKMMTQIVKRNGKLVPFDKEKIAQAIYKATQAVGKTDQKKSEELSDIVVTALEKQQKNTPPRVEEIQDLVTNKFDLPFRSCSNLFVLLV